MDALKIADITVMQGHRHLDKTLKVLFYGGYPWLMLLLTSVTWDLINIST